MFEYVAGVATRQLIDRFGPTRERFDPGAPAHEEVTSALADAGERALAELITAIDRQRETLQSMSDDGTNKKK